MPVRHSGAALLMSLPVFAWLFYWSAFWHHLWGGRRRGCIPKLQQKTSFSLSRSPSVIWALIYVLLWQRLTSFLSGRAHTGTLGGNNKSPGLPSRWAPWRVACVRRSSPLPSPASPEPPIFLPIASSLLLSIFPCPSPLHHVYVGNDKRSCAWVLRTGGHSPSVYASAFMRVHVRHERERRAVFTLMAKYNL